MADNRKTTTAYWEKIWSQSSEYKHGGEDTKLVVLSDFYAPNSWALVNILPKKKLEKLWLKKFTNRTSPGKTDHPTNSKLERSIPVNGKVVLEMDLESRLGLTEQNTQASGVKIELMVKENLYMLMVMFTMDFGLTTKLTDPESTNM